jgi:hypothetical protein
MEAYHEYFKILGDTSRNTLQLGTTKDGHSRNSVHDEEDLNVT